MKSYFFSSSIIIIIIIIIIISPHLFFFSFFGGVANLQDSNIVASEFELQLWYHVHFQTNNLGIGVN